MEPVQVEKSNASARQSEISEAKYERWHYWPVNWSAVSVGTLAVLVVSMFVALSAVALGAHQLTPDHRLVDIRKVAFSIMAIGIIGSFIAFVMGGWVAGKIAGILHSEPAMLHGAIVWLFAVPLLALFSAAGAGGYSGSWYDGFTTRTLSPESPYTRPEALAATATEQQRAAYDADWAEYRRRVAAWNAETPRVTRNAALFAATSILVGLMGAVIGGWMACGEPMSPRYKRPAVVR